MTKEVALPMLREVMRVSVLGSMTETSDLQFRKSRLASSICVLLRSACAMGTSVKGC